MISSQVMTYLDISKQTVGSNPVRLSAILAEQPPSGKGALQVLLPKPAVVLHPPRKGVHRQRRRPLPKCEESNIPTYIFMEPPSLCTQITRHSKLYLAISFLNPHKNPNKKALCMRSLCNKTPAQALTQPTEKKHSTGFDIFGGWT